MRLMLFAVLISCLSAPSMAAEVVAAAMPTDDSTPINRLAEPAGESFWPTLLCLGLGVGSLVLVRRNIEGRKTRRTA